MEVHNSQVIKAAKDIKMNLIPNKYSSMIKRIMPNKFKSFTIAPCEDDQFRCFASISAYFVYISTAGVNLFS